MSKTNSFLRLRPRYYRMFTDDPEEMRESNYAYRELDWKVPLSQAALVCLDVWNRPRKVRSICTAGGTHCRASEARARDQAGFSSRCPPCGRGLAQ